LLYRGNVIPPTIAPHSDGLQPASGLPVKDYSWAEYLDCMEGSDVLTLPTKPRVKDGAAYGLGLVAVVTAAALWLSEIPVWPFTVAGGRHPIEPVMLAIVIGMVVSNLWAVPSRYNHGIKIAVKKILPFGIVCLGARLDFRSVVAVGAAGLVLSVLEIVVALALVVFLSRQFKLPRKLGLLLGVGTAVCGGTAIVATAPVIDADEEDVVFSVAAVTLLGLVAMFVLPVIGALVGMGGKAFGIWAGLAIHQTPQVVAAGFAFSPEAGETATIVKLARVSLLAPGVFVIGYLHARGESRATPAARKQINYRHLFPMFVFGFLAVAILRTLGLLPQLNFSGVAFFGGNHSVNLAALLESISKYCIVISMAGVGLETKFSALKRTGVRPLIVSLIAAIVIAVLIFTLIRVLGL